MPPDIALFLEKNIVSVFLIYGLSLFLIASSIILSSKSLKQIGVAHAFFYLFLFSVAHGIVEWIDMYKHYNILMQQDPLPAYITHIRFYLLMTSFYFLFVFGVRLFFRIMWPDRNVIYYTYGLHVIILASVILMAGKGTLDPSLKEMDIWARHLLGAPAAWLSGIALFLLSRTHYAGILPRNHQWSLRCISVCFILYGFFAGIVGQSGEIFLSSRLNEESFFQFTGAPVQVFRTLVLVTVAYYMMKTLAIGILPKLVTTYVLFLAIPVILAGTGYINFSLIDKNSLEIDKIINEEKTISFMKMSSDDLYHIAQLMRNNKDRVMLFSIFSDHILNFKLTANHLERMDHKDEEEVRLISSISQITDNILHHRADKINFTDIEMLKSMVDEISTIHSAEVIALQKENLKNNSVYRQMLYVALTISIFIFIFAIHNFYYLFYSPLVRIRRGAKEMAAGNLKHRIEMATADEFQEFADHFNIMGKRLLERTSSLEAKTQELTELSIRDGLTGLFNHKYFYSRLFEEIDRAKRHKKNLSLIMIDVDNFKFYNDTHGHQMGDLVLKTIGEILVRELRGIDICCRYGGEELAVILPETNSENAQVCAERLRRAVEQHAFPGKEMQPDGCLSVSIGITSFPDDSSDAEDLVAKADQTLYTAKHEGKNRICVYHALDINTSSISPVS